MYLMYNFYIFATALFASLIMVPAIRRWALDSGAVDFPGERRAHNRAVARAGGVAIFVPFMFSMLVYFEISREVRGVLAGALLIFFTGLADDLYQLGARQKFVGQISGCLVAVLVGHLYLTDLGNLFGLGEIVLPVWAGGLLALFALVGVVNALNLIDGLDGLAGGLSAVALLAFIGLALQGQNMSVLALSSALLGSLLGFLKFNAFPARIFMGDTGSLVAGFLLGCMSILLTQGEGAVSPVVPLMILSVPIVDTLVVMLGRVLHGQSPFKPDRTHLHHKIMALGYGHALTVLLICSLSLVWALLALAFRSSPDYVLFGGLVCGSILLHLALNLFVRQKAQFREGGPSTEILDQGANALNFVEKLSNAVDVLIMLLLMAYVLGICTLTFAGLDFIFVVAGFVSGLTGLLLLLSNRFSQSVIYLFLLLPVLLVNFQVEMGGEKIWWEGLTLGLVTNALFVSLAVLLAYKFIVLKSIDHFFDFTLEFLLFAMGLTLAVVPPDVDLAFHLSGVLSRGIIVFLALRFVTIGSRTKMLLSVIVVNLTLLVMFV